MRASEVGGDGLDEIIDEYRHEWHLGCEGQADSNTLLKDEVTQSLKQEELNGALHTGS